jgi:hypothetical protein
MILEEWLFSFVMNMVYLVATEESLITVTFNAKYNPDSIISCYSEDKYECPDIEQVEKYVAYVAAHEIDALIDKYICCR